MLNNVSNHKQKCSPLQQPKLWLHRVGLLIKKHVSKISNSSTGLFFWQVGRERKRVLGRRSAKGFNIFWQDMTSSNYMFVKMCYKSNRCCFYFPTWSANFFMAPKPLLRSAKCLGNEVAYFPYPRTLPSKYCILDKAGFLCFNIWRESKYVKYFLIRLRFQLEFLRSYACHSTFLSSKGRRWMSDSSFKDDFCETLSPGSYDRWVVITERPLTPLSN